MQEAEAARLTGAAASDAGAGGVNAEVADLPDDDPFAALDRAFAAEAEAARLTGAAASDAGAGGVNAEVADLPDDDPFAALDRAFAAEAEAARLTGAAASDAGAGGVNAEVADLPDDDPFAALDRAFAAEAEAAGLTAPEPATLEEWTRAVNAGMTAAEDAAGEAEAAAGGSGTRLSRRAACAGARDRLESAVDDVRNLTIGEARPAYVTSDAGEETYVELGGRIAAARERGRTACEAP